jgi:ankyrin repeat protein
LQDGHHRKVAALLIARGANVHHQNAVRESALWLASLYGFTEIVEPILRQGVNISSRTRVAALHY